MLINKGPIITEARCILQKISRNIFYFYTTKNLENQLNVMFLSILIDVWELSNFGLQNSNLRTFFSKIGRKRSQVASNIEKSLTFILQMKMCIFLFRTDTASYRIFQFQDLSSSLWYFFRQQECFCQQLESNTQMRLVGITSSQSQIIGYILGGLMDHGFFNLINPL